MLKVPFKQAETLVFEKALRSAIQEIFEEDPDAYQDDFALIANLRLMVLQPQVHDNYTSTMLAYYAQLQYLESKFNISEEGVNLFFTWSNAFGKQDSVSSHNLGFEKASVLFNLAAIYSHLGVDCGISSEEAMKKAATYFQQSAGTFQTILDLLPDWGIQGSANTQLSALSNLMLAQAQEAFLAKAVSGKMKDATLAKLAMQVATFYGVSFDIANETDIFDRNWLTHMRAKQYHFSAVAQFYKSNDCESTGKYGEQVAWLAASNVSSKAAIDKQILKYLSVSGFESELKTFASMVELAYLRAEKDNDKIYMESVPKTADLGPLPPARMVNPIMVPELSLIPIKTPVFRTLVPLKIHQAVSKYSYKKDTFVKALVMKLNDATALAHSTLSSQRLPGSIEALEQPIGLPSQVLERSEEVRRKGGSRFIENNWNTLSTFAAQDRTILTRALSLLEAEEREDEELRRLYGSRWTRIASNNLTRNLRDKLKDYEEKVGAADRANEVVRGKIDKNGYLIEHLGLARDELEASIPSSTISSTLALNDPNLKNLKLQLGLLNKNLKTRGELLIELKKKSINDDIGPKLTRNAALGNKDFDESTLFAEQLKIYDNEVRGIKELTTEQEKLLDSIFTSNKAFMDSHKTNSMIRERETALSNLDIAYKYFKDISGNLEEGIKFYSELQEVLTKSYGYCSDFVNARNMDKEQQLQLIQSGAQYGAQSGTQSFNVSALQNSLPPPSLPGAWIPEKPTQQQNMQQNTQQAQPGIYYPQPGVWSNQQNGRS